MDKTKLDQESLENLLLAVLMAKDERGLDINLQYTDVFTQDILDQLPPNTYRMS